MPVPGVSVEFRGVQYAVPTASPGLLQRFVALLHQVRPASSDSPATSKSTDSGQLTSTSSDLEASSESPADGKQNIILKQADRNYGGVLDHALDDAKLKSTAASKSARSRDVRETVILHGVHGLVQPGESLAIIGPSGSGKTSLLNLLSGRSQYDIGAGNILFDGEPRNPRTKRHVGYVMQDDVFFSNLTVRQTLEFTAAIRLSDSLSKEQVLARVDQVISRLRLERCQHTRIGDQQFDKGISGGERKRVNIANELLADPGILLLDEPTSGLDASTAMTVVRLLHDLANERKTVIFTIHQPSSAMFGLFDKLMLLSEGRVAYFGPAAEAQRYFASIGYPCPPSYNPCDYLMQLVIDDIKNTLSIGGESVAPDAFAETSGHRVIRLWGARSQGLSVEDHASVDREPRLAVLKTVSIAGKGMGRAVAKRGRSMMGSPDPRGLPAKYETSWLSQVRILAVRAMRQKRGRLLDSVQLQQLCAIIVISCLFWFRLRRTEATINDRIGGLFFFAVFWAFNSMFSAIFAFPAEKEVLNKDRSSGAYRLSAYYFAKTLVETPADCIYPALFTVIVYWIVGFNNGLSQFFVFLTLLTAVVLTSQSFGLAISASMMDVRRAQVVAACVVLATMLMAGFYVNNQNIPGFVRPLRYISYLKYSYEALVINEVSGQLYSCVPAGESHTVYSGNGKHCPVSGYDVLVGANLTGSLSVLGNIGVLVIWNILIRLVGYFGLKYLHINHKPKTRKS